MNSQISTGCFIVQFGDTDFNCVWFPITKTHCFTFFRVTCHVSLFDENQSRTQLMSWLSRGSTLFPDLIKVVMSTNIATSAFSYEPGRSLMYIRKRNGPRTEPCGTPVWTVSLSVSISFNLTYCFRSFKKLVTKCR